MLFQREIKASLRQGLAGLPAPKNDYEIVLPDQGGNDGEVAMETEGYVPDQADLDAMSEAERAAQSKLMRSPFP